MAAPIHNINQAVNAYQTAAKSVGGGGSAADEPMGANEDFAALVKGAIKEAVRIGEHSEQLSIAGVNDKADLNTVVTAVAEAELTLQTVVNVRDKVIEAYREIIRMPI